MDATKEKFVLNMKRLIKLFILIQRKNTADTNTIIKKN